MVKRLVWRERSREIYERKMNFWKNLADYIETGNISRDLIMYLRCTPQVLGNYKRIPIVMGWKGVMAPKEGELRRKLEELLSYVSLFYNDRIDPDKAPENVGYIKEVHETWHGDTFYVVTYKVNGEWITSEVRHLSELPEDVKNSIPRHYFRHELAKRNTSS